MWGVISYYVGEIGRPDLWLYDSEEEAIKGLQRVWENCFNAALDDVDFADRFTWHEERLARVAWDNGNKVSFRYFEVVQQNTRETI